MYCEKCGKEVQDGQVCDCQTTVVTDQAAGNSKLFSILSYISILWLLGLLISPEKNDPKVKFHVGQGIILSIVGAALGITAGIISGIMTAILPDLLAALLTAPISLAASAASIIWMVLGIINAAKGEQKQLPIIGQYAFIK
ncbi:MAG: hypothetical protein E7388_02675 [Ruminococcaceae bacterium]|nr:hypothetical protein [Oscillospiraceae bacterium]